VISAHDHGGGIGGGMGVGFASGAIAPATAPLATSAIAATAKDRRPRDGRARHFRPQFVAVSE